MFKRAWLLAVGIVLTAGAHTLGDDDGGTTIDARSLPIALTVPAGWTAREPQGIVQIMATSGNGESVVVGAQARADFDSDLAGYSKLQIDDLARHLRNPTVSDPQSTTVNGQDALRYEVHGVSTAQQFHVGFVVTIVQTDKYYVFILGCSPESQFDANHDDLQRLADGLVEKAE